MAKYTKEAILQMAEEEDVEFIRLRFPPASPPGSWLREPSLFPAG